MLDKLFNRLILGMGDLYSAMFLSPFAFTGKNNIFLFGTSEKIVITQATVSCLTALFSS